jgi:hypothetical protein
MSKTYIKDPLQFKKKIQNIMGEIYDLFELAIEGDATNNVEELEKACFQLTSEYDRPTEFLQSFLDIIRMNYEPYILGTFFLNSNMSFLYDGIPEDKFELAYVSVVSKDNQEFSDFWREIVIPYIDKCGYDFDKALGVYAVVSTGVQRLGFEFLHEVSSELDSGFSVDEAIDLLRSYIKDDIKKSRKQIFAGYCLDSSLETKIRLSLWFFVPCDIYKIQ